LQDWWNAASFGQFYRLWNVVVGQYIRTYIYFDLMRFSSPAGRRILFGDVKRQDDANASDGPADGSATDSKSSVEDQGSEADGLSRFGSQMVTFLISNILHEWIVSFSLGYFYPILFIMFGGPGVLFAQFRTAGPGSSSTFVWMMLIVGTGLLLVLYAREWYARFGCHRLPDTILPPWLQDGTLLGAVVPRSVLAYVYSSDTHAA